MKKILDKYKDVLGTGKNLTAIYTDLLSTIEAFIEYGENPEDYKEWYNEYKQSNITTIDLLAQLDGCIQNGIVGELVELQIKNKEL